MNLKRILAIILAFSLIVAVLCACGDGSQTSEQAPPTESGSTGEFVSGGEITVGIAADLDSSLDPHVSSSAAGTREILFNIFEGLVKPDTEGNIIPAVAESYAINDTADVLTFTLRDGIRFHNGDEVTVGDIVYSITRAAGLETGEPLVPTMAGIKSVEATGDRTVAVTLENPNHEFIANMTAAIIPEGYDGQDTAPVGTGPFRFVSRTAQESIVLEKNPDYWGRDADGRQLPHLDRVTIKIIDNAETMVMSLKSGAVDLCSHLEASQVRDLTNMTILEGEMNLVQALYLNNAVKPFDDVRVRQALSYAIDAQGIIDLAGDGYGSPLGSSMYPSFAKYFMPELTDYYAANTEKAKELLAEAGYADGLSFSITVPSNYTPHVDTAQVIVEQLKAVGVTATIKEVEWASWLSDVYQGRDYETTVCGVDAATLTGSAMLARFASDSAKNFINFSDADYDETLASALAAGSDEERTELYKRCQTILTEQAANVYIQDLADLVAINSKLDGFLFYPLYVMDLSTIHFTA